MEVDVVRRRGLCGVHNNSTRFERRSKQRALARPTAPRSSEHFVVHHRSSHLFAAQPYSAWSVVAALHAAECADDRARLFVVVRRPPRLLQSVARHCANAQQRHTGTARRRTTPSIAPLFTPHLAHQQQLRQARRAATFDVRRNNRRSEAATTTWKKHAESRNWLGASCTKRSDKCKAYDSSSSCSPSPSSSPSFCYVSPSFLPLLDDTGIRLSKCRLDSVRGTALSRRCAKQSTFASSVTFPPSQSASIDCAQHNSTGHAEGAQDSSFQTAAEEAVDSEETADTSGSAMAEHGHRSGSGSGGGGGGRGDRGGDRQSSSGTSMGVAGEEFDGRRYHLRIVQQPTIGAAYGRELFSRLAIQPPLIVQVRVTNAENEEIDFDEEIPFLVCRLNLFTEDGTPADMIAPTPTTYEDDDDEEERPTDANEEGQAYRMMYGSAFTSPVRLPNIRQQMRTFFIFPELSIRSRGRFRLTASLMRLPLPSDAAQRRPPDASEPTTPSETTHHSYGVTLASISTDVFDVVLNAEYVAPHITELTRHFALNGVSLLLPPNQSMGGGGE